MKEKTGQKGLVFILLFNIMMVFGKGIDWNSSVLDYVCVIVFSIGTLEALYSIIKKKESSLKWSKLGFYLALTIAVLSVFYPFIVDNNEHSGNYLLLYSYSIYSIVVSLVGFNVVRFMYKRNIR